MGYFANDKEVYELIGGVFRAAADHPEQGPKMAAAGITVQLNYEDPPHADGSFHEPKVEVIDDNTEPEPTSCSTMPADIAHRYWLGEYNLAVGLAKGQVKAKGPVNKILKLVPITDAALPDLPRAGRRAREGRRGSLTWQRSRRATTRCSSTANGSTPTPVRDRQPGRPRSSSRPSPRASVEHADRAVAAARARSRRASGRGVTPAERVADRCSRSPTRLARADSRSSRRLETARQRRHDPPGGRLPRRARVDALHVLRRARGAATRSSSRSRASSTRRSPHERDPARADRRLRRHHALELPAAAGAVEDRAGARRRQLRRAQARREDAAARCSRSRASPTSAGCRRASSTSSRAPAPRSARGSASHPDVDKVAFTGSTEVGREIMQLASRHGEEGHARARRQVAEHRPRRRRPRHRRRRRALRLLPALRARPASRARGCCCPSRCTTSSSSRWSSARKHDQARRPARLRHRHGPARLARAARDASTSYIESGSRRARRSPSAASVPQGLASSAATTSSRRSSPT